MWHLENNIASFSIGSLSGKVSPCALSQGIHSLQIENAVLSVQALAAVQIPDVEIEWIDQYVRGCDLIANYALPDIQGLGQIYWRLTPAPGSTDFTGIELIHSFQTDRLDCNLVAHVVSQSRAEEALYLPEEPHDEQSSLLPCPTAPNLCTLAAGMMMIRIPDHPWTLLQFVEPFGADELQLQWSADTMDISTRYQIANCGMEKGVIRRGRLLVAVVPRADDCSLALKWYRAWRRSEAPLTV